MQDLKLHRAMFSILPGALSFLTDVIWLLSRIQNHSTLFLFLLRKVKLRQVGEGTYTTAVDLIRPAIVGHTDSTVQADAHTLLAVFTPVFEADDTKG